MFNVIYLIIFVTSGSGLTSQAIPQANMAQCQANARIFNTGKNNGITANSYSGGAKTQSAICIVGVK